MRQTTKRSQKLSGKLGKKGVVYGYNLTPSRRGSGERGGGGSGEQRMIHNRQGNMLLPSLPIAGTHRSGIIPSPIRRGRYESKPT